MPRVTRHRMDIGPDFVQLCGNDDMALPFNAAGGTGCISVTAYVAPALCAQFQAASLAGDGARAHELNRSEEHTSELQSLMRISYAVFCLKKNKHTKNADKQDITPMTD